MFWLVFGHEGELPGYSDAHTDFLPAGCSDRTAVAVEETEIRLETYLLPHLVHPGLLQLPSGSPFHGCRPDHGLLVLFVALLALLGH